MHTVDEIVEFFAQSKFLRPIPQDWIKEWMTCGDSEIIGVVISHIFKAEYADGVNPKISAEDANTFLLSYVERCIVEDRADREWADNSYMAGYSLSNWFSHLWKQKDKYPEALLEIKSWLSVFYKKGDARIRRCLICSVLEHIFFDEAVFDFFSDWKNVPELSEAYFLGQRCSGICNPF